MIAFCFAQQISKAGQQSEERASWAVKIYLHCWLVSTTSWSINYTDTRQAKGGLHIRALLAAPGRTRRSNHSVQDLHVQLLSSGSDWATGTKLQGSLALRFRRYEQLNGATGKFTFLFYPVIVEGVNKLNFGF